MKRIMVMDVMAFVHRCHWSYKDLRSNNGEPSGVIYGMAQTLRNFELKVGFDRFFAVSDAPGRTFRHDMYSLYKSNRSEKDPDLVSQIPTLREMFAGLGVPYVEIPGYEADDIIGSITHQWSRDHEVVIMSGDKDMMQLLDTNVYMFRPRSGGELDLVKYSDVVKILGVAPDQVVKYLSLVGDTADNIPGAAGIGPKTAIKVINQLPVSANITQKLQKSEPNIRLSEELARIKTDIDLPLSIGDGAETFHWEGAAEVFNRLDIKEF